MRDLLIRDVLALTQAAVCPQAAIAVRDGEIAYIGPEADLPPAYAGLPVYEGRGRIAMPGLVNAHTHAAMTLLRGYADDLALHEWLTQMIFPAEARLTDEDVYFGTMLACAEMIRSGTTCFADMYFFMDATARAVAESGMRASLSVGMGSGAGDVDGGRAKLAGALDFCSRWNGQAGGRITTMLAPHAPYTCSTTFIKDVARAARASGLGIHTHVSETAREVTKIVTEYGKSPVEHFEALGVFDVPTLAAHCVAVSERDIDIMAAHGVRVAHNPGSNMKLASGVAPVVDMLAKGIAVGLGTDGAASNNNLDMIEEMRLATLLQKVSTGDPTAMPAAECLTMATMGGARCLGLEQLIGSLEVGKRADLILVDHSLPHMEPFLAPRATSHMVYASSSSDVSSVIIDGSVVMDERRLTTIDETAILAEARRRAAVLVE
jgi:5-methylthioadenosine/S-adenosylhomocysteine deaminase